VGGLAGGLGESRGVAFSSRGSSLARVVGGLAGGLGGWQKYNFVSKFGFFFCTCSDLDREGNE
jgi:hypothetical protein